MSRLLNPAEIESLYYANPSLFIRAPLAGPFHMLPQTAFTIRDETHGDVIVYCAADGRMYFNKMAPSEAGIVAEVRKPEYESPGGSMIEILEGMARDAATLGTNLIYGAGVILGLYLLFQFAGRATGAR